MNSIDMIGEFLAFVVCGAIDSLSYFLSFKKSEKFKLKGVLGG